MPDINELLNLTPPVALIVGINFIIYMVKVSFPSFPRNKIPALCIVIGAVVYPLQDKLHGTVHPSILNATIFGIILGGCAVGLHQVFVQQLKSKFNIQLEGETTIMTKDTTTVITQNETTTIKPPTTNP